MIDKIAPSVADALEGTKDGATVLIGGFGTAGIREELIAGPGVACVKRKGLSRAELEELVGLRIAECNSI